MAKRIDGTEILRASSEFLRAHFALMSLGTFPIDCLSALCKSSCSELDENCVYTLCVLAMGSVFVQRVEALSCCKQASRIGSDRGLE
jgi:hypothetical protein